MKKDNILADKSFKFAVKIVGLYFIQTSRS